MNEGNLIPVRSENEAREKGKKGGQASGVSRRRKKTILQIINTLETCPLNEIGKAELKRGGLDLTEIDPDNLTAMDGAVAGMFISSRRGNHKAFEQLTKYKLQQQKDKLEIEKLKAEIEKLKRSNADNTSSPVNGVLESIMDMEREAKS